MPVHWPCVDRASAFGCASAETVVINVTYAGDDLGPQGGDCSSGSPTCNLRGAMEVGKDSEEWVVVLVVVVVTVVTVMLVVMLVPLHELVLVLVVLALVMLVVMLMRVLLLRERQNGTR